MAPTCLLHISNKFTFLSKKFHSIRCSHMTLLLVLSLRPVLVVAALKRKYQE